MVVKGFYETILKLIIIISLLLGLCVCVDYAANITYVNDSVSIPDNVIVVNDSVDSNGWLVSDGKVYVDKSKNVVKKEKKKVPTISMWARPSIRGYGYGWHKVRFIDYCPNCGHYNCLLKNPKGVYEREYTCKYCDSDFCAVTGKEKYDWSHVYLRRA